MKSRAREQIEKLIEKKRDDNRGLDCEIQERELRKRENLAFILGLQESLRLMPREPETAPSTRLLRKGSDIAKARDAIAKAGHPLHIREILTSLGKPIDRSARASLSGSMSAYFRNGEIFTRPEPNVFGLIEMGTASSSGDEENKEDEEEEEGQAQSDPHLNGHL